MGGLVSRSGSAVSAQEQASLAFAAQHKGLSDEINKLEVISSEIVRADRKLAHTKNEMT